MHCHFWGLILFTFKMSSKCFTMVFEIEMRKVIMYIKNLHTGWESVNLLKKQTCITGGIPSHCVTAKLAVSLFWLWVFVAEQASLELRQLGAALQLELPRLITRPASLVWAQALVHGLNGCGPRASLPQGTWNIPTLEISLVSPAWQVGCYHYIAREVPSFLS